MSSAAEAAILADRVADALRQQVPLAGGTITCSAGVGVTWSDNAAVDGETLVAEADTAMYEPKRLGPGRAVSHLKQPTHRKQLTHNPACRPPTKAQDLAVRPRDPHASE